MAGLGLAGAFEGYMRGKQFAQQQEQYAQQQEQIAKQREMQAKVEAADQEAAGVISKHREDFIVRGGKPEEYQPPEELKFRAAETRGTALARAGLYQQYMQNSAMVAPMKLQLRQRALQQWELDKDTEKLARTVYPTIFDGKQIVGSERIPGSGKIPDFVKLKTSDGKTINLSADDLVERLRKTIADPATAFKNEAKIELERILSDIKVGGQIKVEKAKSGFEADRDERRAKREAENIDRKGQIDFGLAAVNNAAADERNKRTVQGGLSQANVNAGARIKAAEIGAGKSNGGNGGGGKRDQVFDQIHDELIRGYGKENPTSLSGSRTGDELTLRAARYAQDLVDREKLPMRDALIKAGAELKKRRAAQESAGN